MSTLELWEEEIPTATGFAIKIRARRAFGSVSDYSAVLIQNEEMVFVLHKSESLQDAKDALEAIRGVVAPLISGGSVLLTTELLEGADSAHPSGSCTIGILPSGVDGIKGILMFIPAALSTACMG